MLKQADPATFAGILASISRIRSGAEGISLAGLVIFFHVCERDGIGIKELVFVSGFNESLVSRAVDRLSRRNKQSPRPLVRLARHPQDRRRRFVYLTEDGQGLREELVEILSRGGQP